MCFLKSHFLLLQGEAEKRNRDFIVISPEFSFFLTFVLPLFYFPSFSHSFTFLRSLTLFFPSFSHSVLCSVLPLCSFLLSVPCSFKFLSLFLQISFLVPSNFFPCSFKFLPLFLQISSLVPCVLRLFFSIFHPLLSHHPSTIFLPSYFFLSSTFFSSSFHLFPFLNLSPLFPALCFSPSSSRFYSFSHPLLSTFFLPSISLFYFRSTVVFFFCHSLSFSSFLPLSFSSSFFFLTAFFLPSTFFLSP